MRRLLPLILPLAALSGCAASAVSKPTPVPTSGIITRIGTIPPSSPVPVKGPKHKGKTKGQVLKALPTLKPVNNYVPPTPFPASAFTAVIHGTITDQKSRSPIAGAIITVGQRPRHVARTNAFGEYRVTFPAGPDVSVQVAAQGFAGTLAIGHLRKGESMKLNFHLARIKGNTPAAPSPPQIFGTP